MPKHPRLANAKRWTVRFIRSYFTTLPYQRLSAALPFMVVVIAAAACWTVFNAEDKGLRGQLLDRQLTSALARDDFQTARLVLQRKVSLNPTSRDPRFELARVHDSLGNTAKATALMRGLAYGRSKESASDASEQTGEDGSEAAKKMGRGDIRAARWLLQKHFTGRQWDELSAMEMAECGYLLEWIADVSPSDLAVQAMCSEYLLRVDRPRDSLPMLERLIPAAPGYGLRAAAIARQLGLEDQADRFARLTLRQLNAAGEKDPKNTNLKLLTAQCYLFINRHQDAVKTLLGVVQQAQSDEQRQAYGQALGDACVAWIAHRESSGEMTTEVRVWALKLLQVALQHAPNNPRVLAMVSDQVLAAIDQDGEQLAALKESLIQGVAPGVSHFIQGTAASLRDDFSAAELHLELAAKTLPNSSIILNNLAVALANRQDADLERALRISEQAISSIAQPTPHYYETRGQILLKLGRYREAIADLEIGLTIPELAASVHRALSECYAEVGQSELSQQHLAAAQGIENRVAGGK